MSKKKKKKNSAKSAPAGTHDNAAHGIIEVFGELLFIAEPRVTYRESELGGITVFLEVDDIDGNRVASSSGFTVAAATEAETNKRIEATANTLYRDLVDKSSRTLSLIAEWRAHELRAFTRRA